MASNNVDESVRTALTEAALTGKVAYNDLDNPVRIALTEAAMIDKRTLVERWAALETAEFEPWNARAKAASEFLIGEPSVADYGCGAMILERYLAAETAYSPIDVISRDPKIISCDFNVDAPPATGARAAACLGIVEYLYDAERFLSALRIMHTVASVSYCPRGGGANLSGRRSNGWVNDYRLEEFEMLLARCGWTARKRQAVSPGQYLWWLT